MTSGRAFHADRFPLSSEEEDLLDRRAAALAESGPTSGAATTMVITFPLGEYRFGLKLSSVREVVQAASLAVIPGGAGPFVGLLGRQGQALVVADLRPLFGRPRERISPVAVLVIDGPPAPLGLAADDFPRLESIPANGVLPPPPDLAAAGGIVAGVTGSCTLLDAAAVLADPRLTAGDQ